MKRLVAARLLLLLLWTGTAAAQVNEKIDRFTGERRIDYTSPSKAQLGVPLLTIFARTGGATPINGIRFMVSPVPDRYVRQQMQFLGCRKIDWLVDGQPLQLGMVVHDIKHIERALIEFLSQEVTTEQLARLGQGSRVEYRICGSLEGQLSPNDIAAAREIAARLHHSAGAPEASSSSPNPSEILPQPPAMKYRPNL
jgi:hypothetical protein